MPFGGLLTAGIIAAVGGIGGAAINANASGKASQQQVAGIQQGVGTLQAAEPGALSANQSGLKSQEALLSPYTSAGTTALSSLSAGLAPGGQFTQTMSPSDILAQNPGYQFQLQQGEQQIQRAAAANGTGATGGELKDATTYSQGLAENAYQQAFNNFNQVQNQNFNRLQSVANNGQQATTVEAGDIGQNTQNTIGITENTAQQIAQLQGEAGSAQAAGTLGTANAWSGGLSSVGNTALQLAGLNALSNSSVLNPNPSTNGTAPPYVNYGNGSAASQLSNTPPLISSDTLSSLGGN
jgi:hypothetical protein